VRWLLLDAPLDRATLVESDVRPAGRLVDVAVALGLSYGPAEKASSGYGPAEKASSGAKPAKGGLTCFGPAEAPSVGSEPVEGALASAGPVQADPARRHPAERIPLRLLAGDWLCGAMAGFVDRERDAHALSMPGLLLSLRQCGGSMRGRRLELLCVDALCARHPAPTAECPLGSRFREYRVLTLDYPHNTRPAETPTLRALLPHLAGSVLGDDRVEHLQPIAVPVTVAEASAAGTEHTSSRKECAGSGENAGFDEEGAGAASSALEGCRTHVSGGSARHSASVGPLSDDDKASLLRSRWSWAGSSAIHASDLPWLLSEWLPAGAVAVPAHAPSDSQGLFLRLPSGVVGFALKAVGEPGTGWADVRAELAKAPRLPGGLPYTLVVGSLCLAPALREALAESSHVVYGPGTWLLEAGNLVLSSDAVSAPLPAKPARSADAAGSACPSLVSTAARSVAFSVPAGMQLIIANPHAASGGGLGELLGAPVLEDLRALSRDADTDVRLLQTWIPAS